MVRLLAPILTFTCEEVWQYLPKLAGRPESVHLARFPETKDILGDERVALEDSQQQQDWGALLAVREQVLKALEEARNKKLIGKGLEALVTISASEPVYSVLTRYQDQLRYLFIVSGVTVEQAESGNGAGSVKVMVGQADGKKCDRCWNYSPHVGEDPAYPTVCERCSSALKQIEAAATAAESK
jgi:isoleucyl-tRNA synthetase